MLPLPIRQAYPEYFVEGVLATKQPISEPQEGDACEGNSDDGGTDPDDDGRAQSSQKWGRTGCCAELQSMSAREDQCGSKGAGNCMGHAPAHKQRPVGQG